MGFQVLFWCYSTLQSVRKARRVQTAEIRTTLDTSEGFALRFSTHSDGKSQDLPLEEEQQEEVTI